MTRLARMVMAAIVLMGSTGCAARKPCIDLTPTPDEIKRPEPLPRANPCIEAK